MLKAFYSDPHFGHKNILKYCNRPFKSIKEMDDTLIENYNKTITPHDTVLWLGDCFFGSLSYMQDILQRLNGQKYLVLGGHDGSKTKMCKAGFSVVTDYCYLIVAKHLCLATHRPFHEKNKECVGAKLTKGMINIHGHTHDVVKKQGLSIHVGVDAWDYYPALIKEIEALINTNTQNNLPK